MPVEMIGWIAPRVSSEVMAPQGPPFDGDVIAATAGIHERADFDRVLIGYFSDAPDGFLIGAHAARGCRQSPHVPICGGGGSNDAIRALARHIDHYMLWGEPLRETVEFMGQVRQAAVATGKSLPGLSLSRRPIMADADDKAWD